MNEKNSNPYKPCEPSEPSARGAELPNVVRVVAAVIREEDRYLITQRQLKAVLPGLWEFPGGKVDSSETDEQALKREVKERIGVAVEVGERLAARTHDYSGYRVDLRLYDARIVTGAPAKGNVADFRWVTSGEMERYPFPPADQATMDLLLGLPDDD